MEEEILNAAKENDSIGGIIQTAITGLPVGLGDPMFSSLEGQLSNALFSIGGIKGVEFGLGFDFANKKGSEANDEFKVIDGKVITTTNNNGGINGGISNGMPLVFRTVLKPTSSIGVTQRSVDEHFENVELNIKGRHDPCIVRRARVVIDSLVALAIITIKANLFMTTLPIIINYCFIYCVYINLCA